MSRSLCILHANCQGDALRPLLENTTEFNRCFEIRQYTNYTRQLIPDEDLQNCRLFLYQKLDLKWGELSAEYLLSRLPESCQHIEMPNLFFKGYWPFWTNAVKCIDFADSLLELLLGKGLEPEQALYLYLRGDAELLGDVCRTAEESLEREEEKERDSPIRCSALLRERWRQEQLFITVNHPGKTLLFHLTDSLLGFLGFDKLSATTRREYRHPHEDFWLPIHPRAGHMLRLPFASKFRRYQIFSNRLTHQQYTRCYIACRKHNVSELLVFLRNLSSPKDIARL
ncbi:MAG: hypothetical protein LBO64_04115 [Desulfovibrio sp.]|jgi:hypothetical protein|nr:hypothetical protein [Desulfovibrio sp.]